VFGTDNRERLPNITGITNPLQEEKKGDKRRIFSRFIGIAGQGGKTTQVEG
jgi:hypothetical protein